MTTRSALEKEFISQLEHKERSFGRILFHLKRQFDDWAMKNYSSEGYPDVKVGYIPFLMNIGIDGITNKALSEHLLVTKQAMSKTIKELVHHGYITMQKHPVDGRSQLIMLTSKGIALVVLSKRKTHKLTEVYKKQLGADNYDTMIDGLIGLIEIHKSLKI